MGRVICSMSVSLDGFVDSPAGSLDWVRIDEDLHRLFNEETRGVRAMLFGRRMYETLAAYWPTALDDPEATPATLEYARLWKATPKYVFSGTLTEAHPDVMLVRDDAVAAVRRMRTEPGDLSAGGPTFAGSLLAAGLLDEIRLYVNPVLLGGGTPFFPSLGATRGLRLLESRTFPNEVVLLRYAMADAG
jgi:dihydrofolate reductase